MCIHFLAPQYILFDCFCSTTAKLRGWNGTFLACKVQNIYHLAPERKTVPILALEKPCPREISVTMEMFSISTAQ